MDTINTNNTTNNNVDIIHKAFKIRIYPNQQQIDYFTNCFGIKRFAYNWYLKKQQYNYQNKIKQKHYDITTEFSQNREKDFPFVLNVNSRVYRFAFDDAKEAYTRFFKKKSQFPKFKSKKNNKQSFQLEGYTIISKYRFRIPTVGKSNDSKLKIKSSESLVKLQNKDIFIVTISKENECYYATFQYKEEKDYKRHNENKVVGIDLGLKTYATQSNNKQVYLPKQKIIKLEEKIKKTQCILSRKTKGSNNYLRTKSKLNKYYLKIKNITKDFLHQYTTWLAKNYTTIKIEDLNISGMMKNHKLAKAIQRSCFNEFRRMLEYKTIWYDSNLIVVDKFYASSKLCSNCNHKKKQLKLSERVYKCDSCGLEIDRDLNAAINIERYINNN